MNPNVQLALDYVHQGAVDDTSSFTFDDLIGSLAVVYLYIDEQSQQHVYAWYVSGMDLAMRLNAQSRAMFLAISELEVNAADGRFKAYHDVVEQFPIDDLPPCADRAGRAATDQVHEGSDVAGGAGEQVPGQVDQHPGASTGEDESLFDAE